MAADSDFSRKEYTVSALEADHRIQCPRLPKLHTHGFGEEVSGNNILQVTAMLKFKALSSLAWSCMEVLPAVAGCYIRPETLRKCLAIACTDPND